MTELVPPIENRSLAVSHRNHGSENKLESYRHFGVVSQILPICGIELDINLDIILGVRLINFFSTREQAVSLVFVEHCIHEPYMKNSSRLGIKSAVWYLWLNFVD